MSSITRIFRRHFLALGLTLGASAPAWSSDCSLYVTRISAEAELRLEPGQVAIFGYGSLLNLESVARTLDTAYEGPVAIARLTGWERTWTALYPNSRYRVNTSAEVRPKDILYLNIEPKDDAVINGAIIIVSDEQAALIDQREFPYDRKDITANLKGLDVIGGRVYTYVAKPEFTAKPGVRFPEVGVRETYFGMVKSVLPHYGSQFHEEFNASTRQVPQDTLFSDVAD